MGGAYRSCAGALANLMLEKNAENVQVGTLRALPLMEADFNAMNKVIFGARMLANATRAKSFLRNSSGA